MAPTSCTAFAGTTRIASGDLAHVASKVRTAMERNPRAQILIFDDVTSQPVELDLRGTADDVLQRVGTTAEEPRTAGRPKLGVVAREVTLLPQHWEWLASQPGGASVALRKLVEQARKANQGKERRRLALDATYRFLSAMAGNEPGFEEALRALFAGNRAQFEALSGGWPGDIREHARKLAGATFEPPQ